MKPAPTKTLEALIFDECYDVPVRVSELAMALHKFFTAAEVHGAVETMINKGELISGFELTTNHRKMVTVQVAWQGRRAA